MIRETLLPLRTRFSIRFLLFFISVVGIVLCLLGTAMHRAKSEQRAIQELVSLGATYDDWIGWRELLGSDFRPIVEVQLPDTIELSRAMPHLIHLDNLE